MTRILLLGHNPPLLERHSKLEAANYRTWQFLDPLLADGHAICFVAKASQRNPKITSISENWLGDGEYNSISFDRRGWVEDLQRIHDRFRPQCIVAVNFDLCLYSTKLRTQKPIWMDLYGDYLTIIQAASYRSRSDRGISTSIAFLNRVLKKGDQFSVCSETQRHALIGELAMAGRLNWRTFGYEFSNVIRPGLMPEQVAKQSDCGRTMLSGYGIKDHDFVVLWCGGYNTWTDVDTLFNGLEWSMARESRIHYVSLGASTYQALDNTYARFLSKIEQSRFRDRFHMLGWRPWEEVIRYYSESDVGINIDALHYETIYGTRTRLLEMIAAGLPVITSLGSELSFLLAERNAALTFPVGQWRGFGEHILRAADNATLRKELARTAQMYAKEEMSFQNTTKPVREWAGRPLVAPDKTKLHRGARISHFEYKIRSLARQLIWLVAGLE